MENLLCRIGKKTVKISVKVLAAICAGILTAVEAVGKTEKKGGN